VSLITTGIVVMLARHRLRVLIVVGIKQH
jgi:hypothetical protein